MTPDYGTSADTVLDAILSLTYVHDTLACIRCKFADDLATMAVDNDTRQIEYILQVFGQHGPVVEKVGYDTECRKNEGDALWKSSREA